MYIVLVREGFSEKIAQWLRAQGQAPSIAAGAEGLCDISLSNKGHSPILSAGQIGASGGRMDWKHFLVAVVLSGIAGSFADWFFAGVLFHDKYMVYPEVWRPTLRQNDARPIAWSMILGFVTYAAFMAACVVFNIHGYRSGLQFAVLLWLMIPVPLTITNALFIKLHPLIVVSHSLGWLTKLVIAALVVGWLLV